MQCELHRQGVIGSRYMYLLKEAISHCFTNVMLFHVVKDVAVEGGRKSLHWAEHEARLTDGKWPTGIIAGRLGRLAAHRDGGKIISGAEKAGFGKNGRKSEE
ncbi:unnamed protein product [Soboliphyme baturini]|uniref:FBD domain-containing protein n=1 Tax=Soboliphyme baturini TaxID=241478 RepID=A0A183ISQ1_9BILA|nr:unnamed protein product [Soboliphyme baturini]